MDYSLAVWGQFFLSFLLGLCVGKRLDCISLRGLSSLISVIRGGTLGAGTLAESTGGLDARLV